jgi:hypothetical protein
MVKSAELSVEDLHALQEGSIDRSLDDIWSDQKASLQTELDEVQSRLRDGDYVDKKSKRIDEHRAVELAGVRAGMGGNSRYTKLTKTHFIGLRDRQDALVGALIEKGSRPTTHVAEWLKKLLGGDEVDVKEILASERAIQTDLSAVCVNFDNLLQQP